MQYGQNVISKYSWRLSIGPVVEETERQRERETDGETETETETETERQRERYCRSAFWLHPGVVRL